MAVTVPAHQKTVSFKAPYTGSTFQRLAGVLFGRDGYLAGGDVSDNGTTITLDSVMTFVQRGIVVETDAGGVSLGAVPTAAEPWFIVASTVDDHPDTGASVMVTTDPAIASTGVLIAFKANGVWQHPPAIDIHATAERAAPVGLELGGGVALGTVTGGNVHSFAGPRGQVVDHNGLPADLPVATDFAPARPSAAATRTDHIVLRQLDGDNHAEIVYVVGGTVGDAATEIVLATGATVKRPISYAKPGGDSAEQWFAYGQGNALKFLPNGGSTTTVSGSSAVDAVWIGARANADIVVLYLEGTVLKLVSFSPAGTVVDAAVTVANTGAAISNPSAVLDRNNLLHIVFENDEATQQVYYMRCGVDTFAAIDIAPKYARGASSGADDTWPSIGVDRLGRATIAMIRGVSGSGPLWTVLLSSTGVVLESNEIDPSADIGAVVDYNSNLPAAATVFTNLRRPAVVVTPHDEVYVFALGLEDGATDVLHLIAHSPSYSQDYAGRLGFAALSVMGSFDQQSSWGAGSFDALAAAAGEQGEILIAMKVVAGGNSEFWQLTLNTPLLPTGGDVLRTSFLHIRPEFDDGADGSGSKSIHLAPGRTGEVFASYMLSTTAKSIGLAPLGWMAPRHPRDIYLGSWSVPKASTQYATETDKALELFNVRPKSLSYPFLVGNNGDYHGVNAIHDAVTRAQLLGGGEVIVRPGNHYLPLQVLMSHGVSLRGEGRASLTVGNSIAGIVAGDDISVAVTVSGNVVSGGRALTACSPGDLLELDVSGFHVVRRLLPFDGTSHRVLVEDNAITGAPVAPSGTTATLYTSGVRIENLTFVLPTAHGSTLLLTRCYQPELRNLSFELGTSVTNGYIQLDGCKGALLDHIDLTRSGPGASAKTIWLKNGSGALLRHVQQTGDRGRIVVDGTEDRAMLVNCRAPGTVVAYEVHTGGSGEPVYFANCTGVIDGEATTPINAQMVVDNELGDPTRTMAKWVGRATQSAPMIQFAGLWASAAGQAFVDATGRLQHAGDYFFEDFHNFNTMWNIETVEHGQSVPTLVKETTDILLGRLSHGEMFEVGYVFPGGTDPGDGLALASNGGVGDMPWALVDLEIPKGRRLTRITMSTVFAGDMTAAIFRARVYSVNKSGLSATPVPLAEVMVSPPTSGTQVDYTIDVLGDAGDQYATDELGFNLQIVMDSTLSPGGCNCSVRNIRVTHDGGPNALDAIPVMANGHAVELSLSSVTSLDSMSELRTRVNIGAWAEKPLMRMRAKIGDITDVALLHVIGLLTDSTVGTAYFIHDPGNLSGHGASNQLRFVVRNDAGTATTVLTGVTPTANQYYWFWVGWKSATEAYWGISTDLVSPFVASGSLAVGSGVMKTADFRISAYVFNANASVGAPDTKLTVDAIEYSSATRHMT